MKRDALPPLDGALAFPALTTGTAEWRRSLSALALVLLAILAAYAPTGYGIVEIWSRSETFMHGFVVPVIVGWLIWRARHSLSAQRPNVSPLWAIPLAACGFAWLCGEVATVNVVSQLAFVAMLVCTVPLVLGTAVARRMAFPLAFLFFAVPIGEFMLPALMQWTADFTVYGLRLTGVPVYREGQQIVIPSGRWSVVEACSGIRYLIASTMVGTLYAYLTFASVWRRVAFIGISIAIPIVANWIRAYLIVMMGHLSSNRLAVGVDHIIYGWLFFGVVMFLMFWVGSYWREDRAIPKPRLGSSAPGVAVRQHSRAGWSVLLGAVACIIVWPFALHLIDARVESAGAIALQRLPSLGDWHARDGALASWQPVIPSASSHLRQTFSRGTQEIGVHIAFFRSGKVVSSTNALAASGPVKGALWSVVSNTPVTIAVGERSFLADEAELAGPGDEKLIALHWYWIDGRMTSSDLLAKIYTLLARLRGHADGAIVIVYSRAGPASMRGLRDFVHDAGATIESALQRAASLR